MSHLLAKSWFAYPKTKDFGHMVTLTSEMFIFTTVELSSLLCACLLLLSCMMLDMYVNDVVSQNIEVNKPRINYLKLKMSVDINDIFFSMLSDTD